MGELVSAHFIVYLVAQSLPLGIFGHVLIYFGFAVPPASASCKCLLQVPPPGAVPPSARSFPPTKKKDSPVIWPAPLGVKPSTDNESDNTTQSKQVALLLDTSHCAR